MPRGTLLAGTAPQGLLGLFLPALRTPGQGCVHPQWAISESPVKKTHR